MKMKERKVICQYCRSPAREGTGRDVGWGGGKRVWMCARYPECDAYVSADPADHPLGDLANPELRRLRSDAHAQQRRFLNARGVTMKYFYDQWLPQALGISRKDAHIGRLSPDVLRSLIQIMKEEEESSEMDGGIISPGHGCRL